jgi:hypothetical protein
VLGNPCPKRLLELPNSLLECLKLDFFLAVLLRNGYCAVLLGLAGFVNADLLDWMLGLPSLALAQVGMFRPYFFLSVLLLLMLDLTNLHFVCFRALLSFVLLECGWMLISLLF